MTTPLSVDSILDSLTACGYVADRRLATVAFLALQLERPLFLEGEAGVGKTELAKTLASALDAPLIRLQCYDGMDLAQAAYEWNHARQLLAIRLDETSGPDARHLHGERDLFTRDYLIERPLLKAIESEQRAVLLVDELDRADEPFEAFLLEFLAEFQITIPELGTLRAKHPPIVVITSNRTREIHDAIKRRCLYHWVDYPDVERELAIVRSRVPGAEERLALQIVEFVRELRGKGLFKSPGIAETIDWTRALVALNTLVLSPEAIDSTLGALLKYQDDIARIRGAEAAALLQALPVRHE